jgi:hypothetical protein
MNHTARYSPDGRMFVCATQEQVDALEARGWKDCPLDLDTPYGPDKAEWIQRFPEDDPQPVKPAAEDDPPRRKPGRPPKA